LARRRKGRAIDGIVLLDKAIGVSSNHALQQVKRIYFAAKAGHTGALDPLATGMLPICLGEATKFSQFLLDADKTYEVTAKLGIRTTTSDADGDVVETREVDVSQEQLMQAIEKFKGPSKQVPSMFSALKHQGKPLYFYARQGIEIPREARDINIYQLDVTRFEGDEVDMTVRCSKGTYIRSLVDDLGQDLGCGAYVTKLHRTQVANYPLDKQISVEQLEALLQQAKDEDIPPSELLDPILIPMDTAVEALGSVELSDELTSQFMHGQAVRVPTLPEAGILRVYQVSNGDFLGVAEVDDDAMLAPKRLVVRQEQS